MASMKMRSAPTPIFLSGSETARIKRSERLHLASNFFFPDPFLDFLLIFPLSNSKPPYILILEDLFLVSPLWDQIVVYI